MKRSVIYSIIFLTMAQASFAQQIVRDKYTQRQMESMVATRWGKFIPKWYYILLHNKYRKGEDRRTMLQLLPTAAATTVTREQSTREKEDTQQVYEQALWMNYNREIGPVYHLHYKPRFSKLNLEIDALIIRAQGMAVPPSVIRTFQSEHLRFKEQIDIISKGFLTQGASSEGYAEIDAELRQLRGMIQKYIGHQKILNKYTQP